MPRSDERPAMKEIAGLLAYVAIVSAPVLALVLAWTRG